MGVVCKGELVWMRLKDEGGEFCLKGLMGLLKNVVGIGLFLIELVWHGDMVGRLGGE